jgi:hypothetical protein
MRLTFIFSAKRYFHNNIIILGKNALQYNIYLQNIRILTFDFKSIYIKVLPCYATHTLRAITLFGLHTVGISGTVRILILHCQCIFPIWIPGVHQYPRSPALLCISAVFPVPPDPRCARIRVVLQRSFDCIQILCFGSSSGKNRYPHP